MSTSKKKPQSIDTSLDPALQYLNQREVEVAITPTENSTKNVVVEEITQIITNVIQVNAPSGANGQLQFNQGGQYVGDAELQYNPNTDTLTTGKLIAGNVAITGNATNFKLNGGYYNEVLTTDGNGNLSWSNVFPSVSGKSGKFLVTNGVSIDWSTVDYNSLATTTFVSSAIANLVGTAPAMLDTLGEIANIIGQTNDPQFGIISQLANKANISNLAQVAFSGSYSDLSYRPTISTVGSTGNYSDLNGKPTIPATILDLGISDGTNGQVLTTYGNGTYHFSTVATGGGGASTGNITFSDTTMASTNGNVKISFSPTASPAVEFTFADNGNFIASTVNASAFRGTSEVISLLNTDGVGMRIDSYNQPTSIDIGDTTTWDYMRLRFGTGSVTGNSGDVELRSPPMGSPTTPSSISISPQGGANGSFTFTGEGNLSLPKGSVISETTTTTVISPPSALAGQSLVIRPTLGQGISSDHPNGFAPGDTIILYVVPNPTNITGTVDYTFTDCTQQQLGRALIGTLTFTNETEKQITWTVPSLSNITEFTITLSNAQGFGIGGLQPLTLTRTGSSESNHVHLVSGDPTSVDLYLGDDDQYVKIERNGGNVVIGTSTDTKHWTFGTDGDLVLPAGKTIRDSTGVDLLVEATLPQYGYFNELKHFGDNNRVNGEAVAVDSDSNSYLSYSYYNDGINKDVGGVAKFSVTGEKLWSVDIQSPNNGARYVRIASLEYVVMTPISILVALGSYYDDNTGKDVAFMYTINPETGEVGNSLVDADYTSDNGMELNDGVLGLDGSGFPYAVVVGSTYDQKLIKTLTPLTGSTTNKLYFSWTEVNAADVPNGTQLSYTVGGYSGFYMNAAEVVANPAGSTDPVWAGLSLIISSTQSGSYVITRSNGNGYAVNNWSVPVTLTVLGSELGGVDGVNDLTFDFDRNAFYSTGLNSAVSNIQGTPISNVYCTAFNNRDWSTDIGTTLNFEFSLNNQAFIARFGGISPWSKNLGSTEADEINSVVVDGDGNIYAAGDVDNGTRASLVVKYNISGVQQWAVYIDPSNNTRNRLTSIDLLTSGDLITVDRDGIVTKLDKDDGSILWQVAVDTGPNWDSDFRGTATPDGDYIITNYEDNDYTMYVMRISGVNGSSMWEKRITRVNGNQTGEIRPQDDFSAQYIDCNDTYVTIGATTYIYLNNTGTYAGLVYSLPIDGENVDGTYGEYVVSAVSLDWTTETTTSVVATLDESSTSMTPVPGDPTKTDSNILVNKITIGGNPVSPYIRLSALKTLVAASTDFADFQTRISAL